MPTVAAAIRILAGEGVVSTRRGCRPVVVGGAPPVCTPRATAADRLFVSLRDSIAEGTFPSGQPIPKVAVVAEQYRVSSRAVVTAFARLVRDGLAHRVGRLTIAGTAPAPRLSGQAPILAIVVHSTSRWESICTASRTRRFGEAFKREARRCGVRPVGVPARPQPSPRVQTRMGMLELGRLIAESRGGYVGALIAPSDALAESCHRGWVRSLGLRVPEDLSLLSFDNHRPYTHPGLTSVDMGFETMGHRAFHAILGDIPVPHDRHGNIPPSCQAADLGSVCQRESPEAGT